MNELPDRLPFVPLTYAWRSYTLTEKRLLVGLWSAVLLLAGLWLTLWLSPPELLHQYSTQVDAQVEVQGTDSLEIQTRSLPVFAPVARPRLQYHPQPMQAPLWSGGLLLACLLAGWFLVFWLAGRTQRELSFGLALLGGAWVFLLQWPTLVGLPDPNKLVSLALAVGALGPFLWQKFAQRKLSQLAYTLFYAALVMGLLLSPVAVGGAGGLGDTLARQTPVLSLLLLAAALWVGKTLATLTLLFTTNQPQPWRRRPFVQTLLLLAAGQLLLLQLSLQAYGLTSSTLGPLSLGVLFPLALALTPLLSQNLQEVLARSLGDKLNLPVLLMAVSVLVLGWGQYLYLAEESLALQQLDRWLAIGFTGVGLAFVLYVLVNFLPELRRQVNLYFLLHTGPRISIHLVVGVGVGLLLLDETLATQWRSINRLTATYLNLEGDAQLAHNQPQQAGERYLWALNLNTKNAKAAYQLALLSNPQNQTDYQAFGQLLDRARKANPDPRLALYAANTAERLGRKQEALDWLTTQPPNPYVQALQARLLQDAQPDTALKLLKDALAEKPGEGGFYLELAELYARYKMPEQVEPILRAGLEEAPNHPGLVAYAAYHRLQNSQALPNWQAPDAASTWPTELNLWLLHSRQEQAAGDHQQLFPDTSSGLAQRHPHAYRLLKQLRQLYGPPQIPDPSLLYELTNYGGPYPAQGHYHAAVMAYRLDAPELAAVYAARAAQEGLPLGRFLAAAFQAEMGQQEQAAQKLAVQRLELPESYARAAAQELALLQAAHANLVGDFPQKPTANQLLRLGLYAGAAGKPQVASLWYNRLVEEQPDELRAYRYLARIFLRHYGPEQARVQVNAGLEKAPNDRLLLLEKTRLDLLQGQLAEADSQLQTWREANWDTLPVQILRASLQAAQGDTLGAFTRLLELAPENLYSSRLLLTLGDLTSPETDNLSAITPLVNGLEYNPYNPALWRAYIQLALPYGLYEDVEYALRQLVELAPPQSELRKARLDSLEAFQESYLIGEME